MWGNKQREKEKAMQSVGERRGQRCVSPFSIVSHFSSVQPSSALWYMTDAKEDVEVPCGQESRVGGGRGEGVTVGSRKMRKKRGGGEVDGGVDSQQLGGQR